MLLKLSKFFVCLSLLSVIIVLTTIFFPFIGGKYYFFRVSVEAALVFFLLSWAFEDRGGEFAARFARAFRSPVVIAVSCFVLAVLLATLFAYDPNAAFWSNYERGEGGFQMLHYYAFFLLLVLLFTDERDWRLLFKVSLLAAALMILYGAGSAALYEGFIGPYRLDSGAPRAPTFLARLFSNARFQGSLGNPAYVAPYLMFTLFYALYLWRTTSSKIAGGIVYGIAALGALTFFILSESRGAFLGLVAAVFVFLVYFAIVRRSVRRWVLGSLVCLCVVGGLLYANRYAPAIQRIPGSRLLDINLSEQTAQTRFWTWGSAWRGFLERPILGWGPENFSAAFDKYFDPRHFVPGEDTETWFDRAHSVVFDYLAETGILGFGAYLGMFAALCWRLLRRSRAGEGSDAVVSGLLIALPVGYFVQALTLFDVLPIYLNLFLFLAFASYWLGRIVVAPSQRQHYPRRAA